MTRRTRIPDDFTVSEKVMEEAIQKGWPDPRNHLEDFILHHKSRGSLMADWDSALRLWMRNQIKWAIEKGKPLKPMAKPPAAQQEMRLKPRVPETEPTPEQRRENLREFGKLLHPLIQKLDVRKEHEELK